MRWLHFAINSAVVGCFVVFLVVPLVGQVLFPYRSLEEEICMELHSAIFAPGGPYGEVAPMGLSEEEFAAWEARPCGSRGRL